MLKYIFSLCGVCILIGAHFGVDDPAYEKQDDYRLRQYYPALVINRTEDSTGYYFTLELNDLSQKSVLVTYDAYVKYKLGDIAHVERHVTDPEVVNQNNRITIILLFGWLFTIIGLAWLAFSDGW